jgi:hypothetical protein
MIANAKAIHIAKSHEKPTHDQNLSISMSLPTLFLPTLKTNFFGNSSASNGLIYDCKELTIN